MHHSLKAPPTAFQSGVLTLIGPLQQLDYFLFRSFSCRFSYVLGITVLLYDINFSQALAVEQIASCLTVETAICRGIHGRLRDCKVPMSFGCKTSPDYYHPSTSTVVMRCLCCDHTLSVQRTLLQRSCGLFI